MFKRLFLPFALFLSICCNDFASALTWPSFPSTGSANFESTARAALNTWKANAQILDSRTTVIINVKSDYGAIADGVTDDSPAVRRAIAAAAVIVGTNTLLGTGVEIQFPSGSYYFATPVAVTSSGIGFVGDTGRGSKITGPGTLFQVGDYSNLTNRVTLNEFRNLNFYSSTTTNIGSAISLYRTTWTRINSCAFNNFSIAIDCVRASTILLSNSRFSNHGRTTQADAFVKMQGLDETLLTGALVDTNGGGTHITDCEFSGASTTSSVDTTSGILLKNVDGFYMLQSHFTGCVNSIDISPDATPANNWIADIFVENCYFDEPSHYASTRNVKIGGSVRNVITMADGRTKPSWYMEIHFSNCKFRGSAYADYNVLIDVADVDGWQVAGNDIADINFSTCNFRQSLQSSILASGKSSDDVEVKGLIINGSYFSDFNSNSIPNVGGAIHIQTTSGSINGNTFATFRYDHASTFDMGVTYLPNRVCIASDNRIYRSKVINNVGHDPVSSPTYWQDAFNSDYIVWGTTSHGGTDDANPALIVDSNSFASCKTLIDYARTTRSITGIGQNTIISNNLHPGSGRTIKQIYKLTTTDATESLIWDFITEDTIAGHVKAIVTGSNSTGSKSVTYEFYTAFVNNGSAVVLSSGTSSFANPFSWAYGAPGATATATATTNALMINVTGVAAETWTWVCDIEFISNK